MSDDLVKRLRDHIAVLIDNKGHVFEAETLCDEAADRIEKLEDKLAKVVEALQNIAGKVPYADDPWDIACAALKELEDKTDE